MTEEGTFSTLVLVGAILQFILLFVGFIPGVLVFIAGVIAPRKDT